MSVDAVLLAFPCIASGVKESLRRLVRSKESFVPHNRGVEARQEVARGDFNDERLDVDDTDSNIAIVKRDRRHAHEITVLPRILVILVQRINDCRMGGSTISVRFWQQY